MQRLSFDFKGPLLSVNSNKYILLNTYPRMPFAFPCQNINTATVIKYFQSVVTLNTFIQMMVHQLCPKS